VEKGKQDNLFLPFLIAMLVFTNAAYLPYLVLRPGGPPMETPPFDLMEEDLTPLEKGLGENKVVTGIYAMAGAYSLLWALVGRPGYFEGGGGMVERWSSMMVLLGSDRLMVAFSTELFLFWFFQGWMVDDDWKRRMKGRRSGSGDDGDDEGILLRAIGKYVPLLGLGYYMWARPPLPREEDLLPPGGGRVDASKKKRA